MYIVTFPWSLPSLANATRCKHIVFTQMPQRFVVGNFVWLLCHNIVTTHPCSKLNYKKLGPFQVIKKIGSIYGYALRATVPFPYLECISCLPS
jgi:hypothetical protein